MQINIPSQPIIRLNDYYTFNLNIQLDILREDLNHPLIQGNKFRKLKYNLIQAKKEEKETLLTFGGAFSNHIHATAAAGKTFGFDTVGFIRGDELAHKPLSETLRQAADMGMVFEFISREQYRQKEERDFIIKIKNKYPKAYILPEGGTNALAVKGCEEILDDRTKPYDFICLPVGTAGTISGIINTSRKSQKVLGFPALKKADYLHKTIALHTLKSNYEFINAYHFGGYAKYSNDLIKFVNEFHDRTKIPLDPVYNAKMFYGLWDLIQKGYFAPNTKILAIHTGGIQGIKGFNAIHGNPIKVN